VLQLMDFLKPKMTVPPCLEDLQTVISAIHVRTSARRRGVDAYPQKLAGDTVASSRRSLREDDAMVRCKEKSRLPKMS
jgi:hypothetical protein